MIRRTFFKNAFWAALLAPTLSFDTRDNLYKTSKKMIKPAPLRPGDKVALLSPASPARPEKIAAALKNLDDLGFTVLPGKHLYDQYGYLAGTDAERIADLHAAFANPEIDAIWCVRGGYGCTRILHLLDYDLIRKNPKPLIGYSDITALHIALSQKAGLVSFHAQVGGGEMTEFTRNYLQKSLFSVNNKLEIPVFETEMQRDSSYQPFTITPGKATGLLAGGNLALLAAMAGTEFAPVFKNKIALIEDIGEAPYRIDRMLTQLLHGTDLKQAAGIVLGVFNDCEQKGDSPTLTLRETLTDRLASLGIPVYYGAPFGHISDQCVLPMGITASMDADTMKLKLEESGVMS